jgi:hypothetical protein
MSSVFKVLEEIGNIPPPTNPNAADEFDNLRAVVEWHVAASGAQPGGHADLIREIDVRLKDAQDAEAALRGFAVPTVPADLATHNNALLKALESRTAYQLLRKLLERHCAPRCTPLN